MRKFMLPGLLSLTMMTLYSCSSYVALYSIPLKSVQLSASKAEDKVVNIVTFKEGDNNKYRYEDDYINIVFFLTDKRVCFNLQNKTNSTQKIIWDDASFINYQGSTLRITHLGVRYIDRDNMKPATAIPAGGQLMEEITPINNIYLQGTTWKENSLFPLYYKSKGESEAKSYEGKTMKLLLPVMTAESKKDYIFEFYVDKFLGFKTVTYLP